MAFAVRSTGCDSRAPGEPRVVAANRARVTAHVPISNRFTPRQLPRLSAWPSFSVHCSRPQRTTQFAANPTRACTIEIPCSLLILLHIDARLSARDSSVGRKPGAAIVGARPTGVADDQIHIMVVATLSRKSPFRRWLQPDAGFTCGLQPSLSDGAVGRRGALIFEHVRARLPAQSPATAASRAWRSTQSLSTNRPPQTVATRRAQCWPGGSAAPAGWLELREPARCAASAAERDQAKDVAGEGEQQALPSALSRPRTDRLSKPRCSLASALTVSAVAARCL